MRAFCGASLSPPPPPTPPLLPPPQFVFPSLIGDNDDADLDSQKSRNPGQKMCERNLASEKINVRLCRRCGLSIFFFTSVQIVHTEISESEAFSIIAITTTPYPPYSLIGWPMLACPPHSIAPPSPWDRYLLHRLLEMGGPLGSQSGSKTRQKMVIFESYLILQT